MRQSAPNGPGHTTCISTGEMQRASLKRQLILISMCTTTAALLVACTLFLCYDYVTFRDSDLASLDTLATTVGAGTAAASVKGSIRSFTT